MGHRGALETMGNVEVCLRRGKGHRGMADLGMGVDQMKPVNCGCGGEAVCVTRGMMVACACIACHSYGPWNVKKDQAIAAWNRAMSADLRETADYAAQAISGLIMAKQMFGENPAIWEDVLYKLQAALKGGKA